MVDVADREMFPALVEDDGADAWRAALVGAIQEEEEEHVAAYFVRIIDVAIHPVAKDACVVAKGRVVGLTVAAVVSMRVFEICAALAFAWTPKAF